MDYHNLARADVQGGIRNIPTLARGRIDPDGIEDNFHFQTGIGPTMDRLLNEALNRFTSDQIKEKIIRKLFDPMTRIIEDRVKPYIYIGAILYCILIVFLIIIIVLLINKKKQ